MIINPEGYIFRPHPLSFKFWCVLILVARYVTQDVYQLRSLNLEISCYFAFLEDCRELRFLAFKGNNNIWKFCPIVFRRAEARRTRRLDQECLLKPKTELLERISLFWFKSGRSRIAFIGFYFKFLNLADLLFVWRVMRKWRLFDFKLILES